jgi:hypothetical protein
VTRCTGDAAALDRELERRGVYRQYAKVFAAYWRRSGDGVEGLEALRRTIFLLWCSQTQPCCLTGVSEIAEIRQVDVVEYLDSLVSEGVDLQLTWMLGYYHAKYPIVFDRYHWAQHLHALLAATTGDDWRRAEPTARDFAQRGLMGRFWTQVLLSGA